MKAGIAILNWNGIDHLKRFLPSVIEHSKGHQIYVIDNDSSDDSIDYLLAEHKDIRVIGLKTNGGYAGGYNMGVPELKEEIVVLLNSDVEVTEGWIDPILEIFQQDMSIAACQPKILSYTDKTQFEYAGAGGGFIDHWGYPFCRGRMFDELEFDDGQYDDCREVFWASGAAFFVRRDLFLEVGGFDADFFAHMEEIDLCWRLKNLGHKIYYCGKSTVYHLGGGTLPKSNPKKTFLNFRNNLLMLHKNLPIQEVYTIIPIRLVLDGVAGIKFLFTDGPKGLLAVIRAHFAFYGMISKNTKKRIFHSNNQPSQMYLSSIVMDYYLKGKKKFSSLEKLFS